MDTLNQLDSWGKAIVLIGAVVAVMAGFFRWVLPRWRETKADARAIRDTLVGRDAVRDSITGLEILPAVPGIGSRMAHQETQMGLLAEAVADMAKSQRRIDDIEARVSAIEQGHHLERIAGKAESIQLFRTIEAVAQSDPPEHHEPTED